MGHWSQLQHKVASAEEVAQRVAKWQHAGERVVFTNGVFDLLHLGHIDYLSKAADLGQRLVIGLNADESVRTLAKGPARPIKNDSNRAHILAALACVDAVVLFNASTPLALIESLQPDVLVKGGDYDPFESDSTSKTYIVGSDIVRNWGGDVVVIPFLPGHSTSALEQKILDAHSST